MLKGFIKNDGGLNIRKAVEGITIEQKVMRITQDKTPITDTAPMIYTDRSAGVLPELDVRFDKWDAAVEGMDKVHKANLAKKLEAAQKLSESEIGDGKAEPVDTTK